MKRIKVADLPEFDAAPYLGSEAASNSGRSATLIRFIVISLSLV